MEIVKQANGKRKIKISKREWESIGKKAGWKVSQITPDDGFSDGGEPYTDEETGMIDKPLGLGDSVRLKDDALAQHSRSVPAHAGFTTEQFSWRDTLRNLTDQVGTITKVFPNSNHVNVKFYETTIGIDLDQLERA